MKTYICSKVIHATSTKMVNGIPWPDGLPLPKVCSCITCLLRLIRPVLR